MDNFTKLLTNILDCGAEELALLKNVSGDWNYIIRRYLDDEATFDTLIFAACMYGIERIDDIRKDEISSCQFYDLVEDDGTEEKIEALERLYPMTDILIEVNGSATKAYISSDVSDVYREYLSDAMEEFESITGVEMYW